MNGEKKNFAVLPEEARRFKPEESGEAATC
jgi:hypothetical protein